MTASLCLKVDFGAGIESYSVYFPSLPVWHYSCSHSHVFKSLLQRACATGLREPVSIPPAAFSPDESMHFKLLLFFLFCFFFLLFLWWYCKLPPPPLPSCSSLALMYVCVCVCVCFVLVLLGPLPSEPQCVGPHSSLAIEYECAVFRPWGDGARVTEKQRGSNSGGEGNLPSDPLPPAPPLPSPFSQTTTTFSPDTPPLNCPFFSLSLTHTSLHEKPPFYTQLPHDLFSLFWGFYFLI